MISSLRKSNASPNGLWTTSLQNEPVVIWLRTIWPKSWWDSGKHRLCFDLIMQIFLSSLEQRLLQNWIMNHLLRESSSIGPKSRTCLKNNFFWISKTPQNLENRVKFLWSFCKEWIFPNQLWSLHQDLILLLLSLKIWL